jgi:hypothetical protein
VIFNRPEEVILAEQRIIVFEQFGSAEHKIRGIRQYGCDLLIKQVVSVDQSLPEVVDEPELYLPEKIDADLVLDFLKHPDLSYGLAIKCLEQKIPIVASGKRIPVSGLIAPPT